MGASGSRSSFSTACASLSGRHGAEMQVGVEVSPRRLSTRRHLAMGGGSPARPTSSFLDNDWPLPPVGSPTSRSAALPKSHAPRRVTQRVADVRAPRVRPCALRFATCAACRRKRAQVHRLELDGRCGECRAGVEPEDVCALPRDRSRESRRVWRRLRAGTVHGHGQDARQPHRRTAEFVPAVPRPVRLLDCAGAGARDGRTVAVAERLE